jgi:excisionase family DNA binding protein
MSASDAINDLIELKQLAEQERDAARRHRLLGVHERMASRTEGVRVSQAAEVLGVSTPTVRSWLDANVLIAVQGKRPMRVTAASLAAAKRAVDEIRSHRDDRHLLADVARLLRDRAALGSDARAGIEDMRAGRVTRLDRARLNELLPPAKEAKRSSST